MPAVYRIEAYVRDSPGGPPVPWILSNPIYAGLTRPARAEPRRPAPRSANSGAGAEATLASGAGDRSELGPRHSIRRCGALPVSRRSPGRSRSRRGLRPASLRRFRSRSSAAWPRSIACGSRCRRRSRCARGFSCARRSATPSGGASPSMRMQKRAWSMCRSRVQADRRDVERAAAARPCGFAAVRGGYDELPAGRDRIDGAVVRSRSVTVPRASYWCVVQL